MGGAPTAKFINGILGTLLGNALRHEGTTNPALIAGPGSVIVPSIASSGALVATDTDGALNVSVSVAASNLANLTGSVQTQLNRREVSLFDYFADANNGTTVETDLTTSTIAAGQLTTNGDKLKFDISGIYTGAASSTQELKVKFAGTAIFDSGALSIGAVTASWRVTGMVIRESSSVVRCIVEYASSSSTLAANATYTRITGLTLSNTQILKTTGQAAGASAASNQITSKFGNISYLAH